MLGTKNRNIKILGATWLGVGALFFALVLSDLLPRLQGQSALGLFESGDAWWIVALVFLVIGAICTVSGLGLLRRNPVARPFLIISSIVLVPLVGLLVPILLLAPSLWLTLSGGGKEAFESYVARANG